jgi:hypothetical protein
MKYFYYNYFMLLNYQIKSVINNQIKIFKMSSVNHECPICFDDIDVTNNYIITECGHHYHARCLLSSVAFGNFACPCCRFELAEQPEEEDDEDEDDEDDYDEEEEDETFQSMRWLFQRAEGEELEPEYNDDEEDDEEEIDVPASYVCERFANETNYNVNDFITILVNDFLCKDQDPRSENVLDYLNTIIESYEERANNDTNNVAPNNNLVIDLTGDSDDEVVVIPEQNNNIVTARYQNTIDLCGNN